MTHEEFEIYHKENPQVYQEFEKFTLQVISSGRKFFSARAIYERMRWQSQVEDNSKIFKLKDHPMPFYARLFEKNNPEYAGFFRKRRCSADNVFLSIIFFILFFLTEGWAGIAANKTSESMSILPMTPEVVKAIQDFPKPANLSYLEYNRGLLSESEKIMDELTYELTMPYPKGNAEKIMDKLKTQAMMYQVRADIFDTVISSGEFMILTKRPADKSMVKLIAEQVLDRLDKEMLRIKNSSSSAVGEMVEAEKAKKDLTISSSSSVKDLGDFYRVLYAIANQNLDLGFETEKREIEAIEEQFHKARDVSKNIFPYWELDQMAERIRRARVDAAQKAKLILEVAAMLRDKYERFNNPGAMVQTSCITTVVE